MIRLAPLFLLLLVGCSGPGESCAVGTDCEPDLLCLFNTCSALEDVCTVGEYECRGDGLVRCVESEADPDTLTGANYWGVKVDCYDGETCMPRPEGLVECVYE